jgi:hypothetical protein
MNTIIDSIDEGEESIISVANINNNGQFEFLIGNKRGGLGLYTEYIVSSVDMISASSNTFVIAPNPTNGRIKIEFATLINKNVVLQVTNMLGQTVLRKKAWLEQSADLNLQNLPTGTYVLSVETDKERYISKLIKQ